MTSNTFDLFTLSCLLILAVAMPLIGIWDFNRLKQWIHEGRSDARMKTYQWILFMEWGLTAGLLGWWLWAGKSLGELGLVPAAERWQWLAIGLGFMGVAYLIYQLVTVSRKPAELAKIRQQMGDLAGLAPQTPSENRMFAVVSVTAGVCEEIIYRGLLLAALSPLVGTWPAVILTSVIFGLGHAYQGLVGIGKTALVGLVMALLTVFSGSLFIPILLHTVIDLTSGRLMGLALQAAPEPMLSDESL